MDKTKIAVDIFDKYAHEYQNKFMNVDLYKDSLDLFCSSVKPKKATVLEIACGPGNITQYLLKKRPNFNILGIDLAPNMLKLAKINNPTAHFQIMDARDIRQLSQKYDAILCGFCLPYLSKEETLQLIQNASKLLNPHGILYLSTMEDDYSKSGFKKGSKGDEIFMHYHEAGYLSAALEENGFKIIDLQRKVYPEADGIITTDLLIIASYF